jgi:4-amino-4-deoxy-L-arabinose transferase-like glycosyltransferase
MSTRRAAWIFVLLLTAIRLTTLATKDLEFDEAHYWLWSDRLAPAYFTKGPAIAFVIRAGTSIFGANEFGVRFFSPLFAAATSLLLFYFGRRLFGEIAALWLVIALNVVPIFNLGAFLMTIDALSIFFWTASMFTFWLAIERSPQFSFYWPATGLLIGLGFLSKYTNSLELISVILVLALAPRLRQEFSRPGLYSLLALFLLCTIPPIIWNSQHAWVTLSHLENKGGLADHVGIHPLESLKFLGEHFLFYSPLLFLALVVGVYASFRRINQQLKVLFLFWFGVPVFVFYLFISINKLPAPNWDALAFVGFGLLAAYAWRNKLETNAWMRRGACAAIAVALLMSMVALDSDILNTIGAPVARRDPSDRLRGWRSATQAVEKLRDEWDAKLGQKLFLIADDRDRASEVSFYLRDKRLAGPGHPPVYLVESQDLLNQFSLWPRYDEFVTAPAAAKTEDDPPYSEEGGVSLFAGRSALFIRDGANGSLVHNVRAAFGSAFPVATIEVLWRGKKLRTWRIFVCQNYRTLPL